MMNTIQIDSILKKNCPHFKGVYARNRLPRRLNVPCALVCNTDPDTLEGEHWIAVHIDGEGHGEYYDPFGFPPTKSVFTNFMDRQCRSWTYNDVRVQHFHSLVCGQHCIFYIVQRCKGKTMSDITSLLKKDFHANTYFVDDFVRTLVS